MGFWLVGFYPYEFCPVGFCPVGLCPGFGQGLSLDTAVFPGN